MTQGVKLNGMLEILYHGITLRANNTYLGNLSILFLGGINGTFISK
jgi:hypothetical protein